MTPPPTHTAYRRTNTGGPLPHTISRVTEPTPATLAADEVLLRIHAVSLNFRDVAMLDGRYPIPVTADGIPASDCAAEVLAVGSGVRDFAIGDRVTNIQDLACITDDDENPLLALGGEIDGVLRQYAVFKEKHLIRAPEHLPWEEASIIPCTAITAWVALNMPASIGKIKSALLQGTGGVSLTAAILCLAAGIHPIITSSSSAKLAAITAKLGGGGGSPTSTNAKISTINYHTHPAAAGAAEAKRLTDNRGVDVVLNNAGPSTLPHDVEALVPRRGIVAVVGFLGGLHADGGKGADADTVLKMMLKNASVRGVGCSSKADMQRLNDFITAKGIRFDSIIDRTFEFEEAEEAFKYLRSGKHTGKIVIKV